MSLAWSKQLFPGPGPRGHVAWHIAGDSELSRPFVAGVGRALSVLGDFGSLQRGWKSWHWHRPGRVFDVASSGTQIGGRALSLLPSLSILARCERTLPSASEGSAGPLTGPPWVEKVPDRSSVFGSTFVHLLTKRGSVSHPTPQCGVLLPFPVHL